MVGDEVAHETKNIKFLTMCVTEYGFCCGKEKKYTGDKWMVDVVARCLVWLGDLSRLETYFKKGWSLGVYSQRLAPPPSGFNAAGKCEPCCQKKSNPKSNKIGLYLFPWLQLWGGEKF